MALTRKEEMEHWKKMPFPKPDWETFKRMMPQFGGNPLAVQIQWERKLGKIQAQSCNNHHQDL
jgi:hypothetical protein